MILIVKGCINFLQPFLFRNGNRPGLKSVLGLALLGFRKVLLSPYWPPFFGDVWVNSSLDNNG